MKKFVFTTTILAILALLVACSKTSNTTGSTTATDRTNAPLSSEAELLVGTFKLENSDLAISAAQAKTLLPLWQTLQALSNSSTAATEEVNAVVDQIKSSMTTQQVAKITAMKLTGQDMMSIMSQAGVSSNSASTTATPMALNGFPGGADQRGSGQGGGGGMPSGGPPDGGGGMPSGGGAPGMNGGPTDASSTPQAPRQNANQVPPPLLNALIELLQKKVQK